jgi:hypothetical protein
VTRTKFNADRDVREWTGAQRPYDILKEGAIALLVVALLTAGLAAVFGSPDEKQVTIRQWSSADPVDFATSAFRELSGTSGIAGYGAPYNNASDGQFLGITHLYLAQMVGVHIPIDPARTFVLQPLTSLPDAPTLRFALSTWASASDAQRQTWLGEYGKASLSFTHGQLVATPGSLSNPVDVLIASETAMARSGALDSTMVTGGGLYSTDYTNVLLFIADGGWFATVADHQHLLGSQWGMMNETGSYPGQAWLWLYTFWYQIHPFATSGNADVDAWGIMMILTAGLIMVPYIPGLRSIPRRTKLYRVIWRDHYAGRV